MPKFSEESKRRLSTCDVRLQVLFNKVIEGIDCTILCGHRGKEEQDKAYAEGNSKLLFPHSKHNKMPSRAVDVMKYPIEWENDKANDFFAGYVMGVAAMLGLKVIWGGNWKTIVDKPHFEIAEDTQE